jgi:rubrerythrin
MKYCDVHMDSLHLKRNDLLEGLLKKRENHLPKAQNYKPYYWEASTYGLDRLDLFQNVPLEIQSAILSRLSQLRLEEAYHIEKAGIAFGAKMILESQTFEERKLYAHFAAEESEHLAMIESYLDHITEDHLTNSFLLYLSDLIKNAPKEVLVFMIQVVLEGWGLEHYTELAKTCNDPSLQKTLKKIVQDEAGHHGAGMILFKESQLSAQQTQMITQALRVFLNMVRVGPYSLITTLKQYLKLDSQQVTQTLIKLQAAKETNQKLLTLRSLAIRSGANKIIQEMDNLNLYSVTENKLLAIYGEL